MIVYPTLKSEGYMINMVTRLQSNIIVITGSIMMREMLDLKYSIPLSSGYLQFLFRRKSILLQSGW